MVEHIFDSSVMPRWWSWEWNTRRSDKNWGRFEWSRDIEQRACTPAFDFDQRSRQARIEKKPTISGLLESFPRCVCQSRIRGWFDCNVGSDLQSKSINTQKYSSLSLAFQTITNTLAGFTDIFVFTAGTGHDRDDVPCLTIGRTIENGLIAIDEAIPSTGTEACQRSLCSRFLSFWMRVSLFNNVITDNILSRALRVSLPLSSLMRMSMFCSRGQSLFFAVQGYRVSFSSWIHTIQCSFSLPQQTEIRLCTERAHT